MPGGRSVEKAKAIQLREALRRCHGPAIVRVLDTTHMTAQQVRLQSLVCDLLVKITLDN